MPGFFFRPIDLSSLALLFVAMLVGWRLWTLRPRTAAGGWLTRFFAGAALFALSAMVANTRLDSWQFYAIHLQVVFSALAVASLLQYVYRVGEVDPDEVEARRVWLVSLLALLYITGWAVYHFSQLTPSGNPSTNTLVSEGLTALGLVWCLVVAIRQARFQPGQPHRLPASSYLGLLIVSLLLLLISSGFQFIGGLLDSFTPKATYTSYVVAIGVILLAFNYFLDWDRANTRVNRAIAAALVVLQSVFALLGLLFGAQLAADSLPITVAGDRTIVLQPNDQGGYSLEEGVVEIQTIDGEEIKGTELVIRPPFPLTYFGEEYSTLLIRQGRLMFGERWSAQKAGFFLQPNIFVANLSGSFQQAFSAQVAQSSNGVAVRWSLPDGSFAQASLYPDGQIKLIYAGLTTQPLKSWALSAGNGIDGVAFMQTFPPTLDEVPENGIAFEDSFAERQRVDSWTRPIVYFQLVVSILAFAVLYSVQRRLTSQDNVLLNQTLTSRQRQIVELVAEDKSNGEIGVALNVTEATVKYHLTRIFQLLGVDDRQSLAAWYRRQPNPAGLD